jgi:hypothetical protein
LKREFFVLLCPSSFQQPTQTKTRKNKLRRRRRRRQNCVRSSLYIIIISSSIIINIIIKYKYRGETSLFLSSHDSHAYKRRRKDGFQTVIKSNFHIFDSNPHSKRKVHHVERCHRRRLTSL